MNELHPVAIPIRHPPRSVYLTAAMWFAIAAFVGALCGAMSLLSGCA